MSQSNTYPKIAIVGRTNVGKSTLFNRISNEKKSIVFDREGVTRDFVHDVVTWDGKSFDLIDTGGLPLKKDPDPIAQHVRKSVESVIQDADIIFFICDGKEGLANQDRDFAKLLHKTKKPILLVINKADNTNAFAEHSYEFHALGFDDVFPVSAIHGTGIRELLDTTSEKLGESKTHTPKEASLRIAILGKPNVGKSSLLNLLLKKERSIVSEVAGTTRESISETIQFHKELIQITDTAGIRRKSKIDDPLEITMVKRSLQSIREADIILFLIDASEGQLADQELKLLFYAFDEKKSIILVINKVDLQDEQHKTMLEYDLEKYEFFFKKIPIIRTSCVTSKNIGLIFKEIQKAQQRRKQPLDEIEINDLILQAFIRKPMYHKTILLKVLNVKVIKNAPIPTFILYVNFPQWFGSTQLGFIENTLRKQFDFLGCPIQFNVRKV